MKTSLLLGTLALVLGGCANVGLRMPVYTKVNPLWQGLRPVKTGTFAFVPEADMRSQKALFYARIRDYLSEEGYRFVDVENADFLILVLITPRTVPLGIDVESGNVFGAQVSQGDKSRNEFHFLVYLGRDKDALSAASKHEFLGMAVRYLWRAAVYATPIEFRSNEKPLVKGIFARLGEDFHGSVVIPQTVNQSMEPAPSAVH